MRILGIDMSAMFRRHYEATERDGAEARKRTVAEIVAQREGFDRVALCLDGGRSFRAVIEPAYKAQRERPPAAYGEQLRRAIDRLVLDGCVAFEAPPVDMSHAGGPTEGTFAEGDDVLAALAQWCADNGHALRIVGGDKDLLQLIDDEHGIEVLRPESAPPLLEGEEQAARAWRAAHVERFHKAKEDGKDILIGVPPARVADVLALAGDGSDNFAPFPGWTEPNEKGGRATRKPGIGMTTAIRLVQKFGTAIGVIDSLTTNGEDGQPLIKGHVAEVLKRAQPNPIAAVHRGLNLATLHRTLKIDFAPLLAEPVTKPIVERDTYFGERVEYTDEGIKVGGRLMVPGGAPHEWVEKPAAAPAKPEPPEVQGEPVPPPRRDDIQPHAAMVRVEASPIDPYALQPRDLTEVETVAAIVMNSRAYGFGNPEQVMLAVMDARERGIPVGVALRSAYNVNGRLAWSAAYLAGLVLASGKAEIFEIVETTPTKAVVAYKRKGRPEGRFEYTLEEARSSKLVRPGSQWEVRPRTMLRWAALREAARAYFPDVTGGMYGPDELGGDARPEEMEGAA